MTKRTNPIINLCLLFALSATGCNTAPATPGVDPVSTAAYPNVVIDPSLEDVLVRSEPTVAPPRTIARCRSASPSAAFRPNA